jgi:N-acetylmuramoyl-L-alanine amidase
MGAEYYPGALWMPGRNAGWAAGTNAMQSITQHYTVGVDSTGILLDGYFHALIGKGPEAGVKQAAEWSAVTWHAGEANWTGPGIEYERLGDWEPLTAYQIDEGGKLNEWLAAEWGLPLAFYDTWGDNGARVPPGSGAPYITHRSWQQSAPHSDYITYDDWNAMVAPAPSVGGLFVTLTPEQEAFIYNALHCMFYGTNPGDPNAGKPGGQALLPPGPWADMWAAAKGTRDTDAARE